MERNQLRYIVEVAKCGNITRAAEKLHIAQPSLSSQIINLERELGVSLFERTKKRVRLTDAGDAFAKEAQHILNEIDHLAEMMESFSKLRAGRLRIGALSTMVPLGIPFLISDFSRQYPALELSLMEAGSSELIRFLNAGELDAALVMYTEECHDQLLASHKLIESRLMAIVNKAHPLACRTSLTIEDFRDQKLIITTSNFNLQRLIIDRMESQNIPFKISTRCNQIETCYILADQGMGISFCTESTIGYYPCSNVVYLPVENIPLRTIYLIYKKDPQYYPALKSFIDFITEHYKTNAASSLVSQNSWNYGGTLKP